LLTPRLSLFLPFTDVALESSSTCVHCAKELESEEARWGSGLCDGCYHECRKECHVCCKRLQLQHFCAGLCDGCRDSSRLARDGIRCQGCAQRLDPERPSAEGEWGSGLCDKCSAYEKECRACKAPMELGQLSWGTGLCVQVSTMRYHARTHTSCHPFSQAFPICPLQCLTYTPCRAYTLPAISLRDSPRILIPPPHHHQCHDRQRSQQSGRPPALSPAVRMLILAQLVFYLAPAIMLPGLYLHIRKQPWGGGEATSVYAAVLTACTVVAMAAPLPLGMWAEWRGVREVRACGRCRRGAQA
jgi:hypothetical protein